MIAQKQRQVIDKKLGIVYPEDKKPLKLDELSSEGVSGNISSQDLEEMDEK